MSKNNSFTLESRNHYWLGNFSAMASPCEVFIDTDNAAEAEQLISIAFREATRIEQKYSRYRQDNIIYRINNAQGKPIEVDDETARMLDYAANLYELSDGLFDITSGVLRRVWRFDGSDNIPDKKTVDSVMQFVGWTKVQWQNPVLTLPTGMEIDLGGIGKEYAVDRSVQLLLAQTNASVLVNYGGDLKVSKPRRDGNGWYVGLDDPANTGSGSLGTFELKRGGIATSGDARRYLLRQGVRYSHILDPRTGWPVKHAPRGISVVASTCTEAGMLATFAMLQGQHAEAFLREQEVQFWCY